MAKRYFEYTGDSSSRFWEISTVGKKITVRYGSLGSKGQSRTTEMDGKNAAASKTNELVNRKQKSGYVETTSSRQPSPDRIMDRSQHELSNATTNTSQLARFVAEMQNVTDGDVYTMFFLDDEDNADNPRIRALFSYARADSAIVFHAVGLTDYSRGTPLQHSGLIRLATPVECWRFEGDFEDEVARALIVGPTLHDLSIDECECGDVPSSTKLRSALKAVRSKTEEFYFIDDDCDEQFYRITPLKLHMSNNGSWVQSGFRQSVYQVAESVLQTASGWMWEE